MLLWEVHGLLLYTSKLTLWIEIRFLSGSLWTKIQNVMPSCSGYEIWKDEPIIFSLKKKVSPNEKIGRYLDCVSKGIDEFRYDRMWHCHTRVMIEFIYIITSVISLSFISSMNCHRRWLPLFRFFFSLVRMWRIFFAFILVCSGPRVWFSEISSFFSVCPMKYITTF